MANTTLSASIIAKAALGILENELVMANAVYRGYEDEFDKKINGYTVGDTITIRKPTDFTVRSTITASAQDATEGKTSIQVNQIAGVDFAFTSQQLTQNIKDARRARDPPGNGADRQPDRRVRDEPLQGHSSVCRHARHADPVLRGVCQGRAEHGPAFCSPGGRTAVLAPADFWALAGSQTALFSQAINNKSYREGEIGKIGGIDTYMSQNAPTFLTGPFGGTPAVNGASQNTTYDTTGANTQTLITDGWTAAAAARVVIGDVFTIAGVFDVNPVTKATLPILKQFVVKANGSSDGSGNLTLTISPQIITSGAFQTVSAVPGDTAAMTFVGTANTNYTNNLFFDKNAFALVTVPLVKPAGAVECSRQSKNGISVRVIPFYDGVNDKSTWRLDVLYGTKTIDPRLAVRVAGT
jgi:hypothetical protein